MRKTMCSSTRTWPNMTTCNNMCSDERCMEWTLGPASDCQVCRHVRCWIFVQRRRCVEWTLPGQLDVRCVDFDFEAVCSD